MESLYPGKNLDTSHTMPPVNTRTDTIPDGLKQRPQWVCWRTEHRDSKPTKVPVNPMDDDYASVTDPETWATYAAAHTYHRIHDDVDGLGYVFAEDGPYTGVDLDDCRDPESETVEEWALSVILRLDSFTELSPSGTGYHVIVRGGVPDGGNRRGPLEMYDRNRYFTVTGDHVHGTPTTIQKQQAALDAVHEEYIADDTNTDVSPAEPTEITLSDEELIERAMHAANGDKFRKLWIGNTAGYDSHSEADQALCNLLAFWTGGDRQRMERLFSKSGLVRDKWKTRPDYRERTIRTAIRDCPSFYEYGDTETDTARDDTTSTG